MNSQQLWQNTQDPYKLKPEAAQQRGGNEVPPLAEEILVIANCWEKKGQFSSEM